MIIIRSTPEGGILIKLGQLDLSMTALAGRSGDAWPLERVSPVGLNKIANNY